MVVEDNHGIRNVTKCAINPLAINTDIISYSRQEMEKMNFETVRVNKRNHQNKKKQMSMDIVDKIMAYKDFNDGKNDDVNKNGHFINQPFARHQEALISNGVDNN